VDPRLIEHYRRLIDLVEDICLSRSPRVLGRARGLTRRERDELVIAFAAAHYLAAECLPGHRQDGGAQ
jgi:hypothetical protein